jgi:long-chain-acyl-CoA dehydrogenase
LGTDEQKRRCGCVAGDHVLALAMTEPGQGRIWRDQHAATRSDDTHVVDGAKTFISNGQTADLFVVAVRAPTPDLRARTMG